MKRQLSTMPDEAKSAMLRELHDDGLRRFREIMGDSKDTAVILILYQNNPQKGCHESQMGTELQREGIMAVLRDQLEWLLSEEPEGDRPTYENN